MKTEDPAAKLTEALQVLAEAVERVQIILRKEDKRTLQKVTGHPQRDGLLTEEELRIALGLSNVWAVRDLKKKSKIPFIQLGHRTVRYDLAKVLKALEKREVKEAGRNHQTLKA